ncbi:MAG TPA: hypothetical protein VK973_07820, partial [Arenicellales bacterium]|nr:hypothetical protein [Arenicellales bacterium]
MNQDPGARISGEKIWERKIPVIPEVDSLTVDLAQITENRSDYLPAVRKYVWGATSTEGDLYLITYNNIFTPVPARPLWIHRFDPKGKLIQRYKITSNTNLSYHLAVDFNSNQLFVPL